MARWERSGRRRRSLRGGSGLSSAPASCRPPLCCCSARKAFAPRPTTSGGCVTSCPRCSDRRGGCCGSPGVSGPRQLLAELCGELDLVHVVDPMQGETVTPEQTYYRLHGTTGSRHVVVLLAAVMVARGFLVPKSYGMYGPYRYDNVAEQMNIRAPAHRGPAACGECHTDRVQEARGGQPQDRELRDAPRTARPAHQGRRLRRAAAPSTAPTRCAPAATARSTAARPSSRRSSSSST